MTAKPTRPVKVESEPAMRYARLGEIIEAIIRRHYEDEARKGEKGAA